MAYSSRSPGQVLSDYAHLRTIPALLGIVFSLSSLYQFGGISQVNLTWLDYTLTSEAAMMGSLLVFVVACASSETKDFDYYDGWEKALVAAGPVLIVVHQYVGAISTFIANNSPVAGMLAFLITLTSWGVAVR